MWISGVSPHRPSNVQLPSASKSIACRQPSSVTVTRGQGRCRLAVSRCVMLSSSAMTLSQQLRNVLEASNQRRRHIETGHEYDGEVGEHRNVGGLSRCG